jgi:hypothetical protein
VADFSFTPQFLQELAEWEASAAPRERDALDQALAAIVMSPALPGRVPSFYDPLAHSYLYRVGRVLIHYRIVDTDQVQFLNLFYAKS